MQCAVFGVPDPRRGEAVAAAVVLKSESTLTREEIIDYCRRKLSSYKTPKYVVFRSNLPTTSAGKLLKIFEGRIQRFITRSGKHIEINNNRNPSKWRVLLFSGDDD